jgi:hypothetical protein
MRQRTGSRATWNTPARVRGREQRDVWRLTAPWSSSTFSSRALRLSSSAMKSPTDDSVASICAPIPPPISHTLAAPLRFRVWVRKARKVSKTEAILDLEMFTGRARPSSRGHVGWRRSAALHRRGEKPRNRCDAERRSAETARPVGLCENAPYSRSGPPQHPPWPCCSCMRWTRDSDMLRHVGWESVRCFRLGRTNRTSYFPL